MKEKTIVAILKAVVEEVIEEQNITREEVMNNMKEYIKLKEEQQKFCDENEIVG